MSKRTQQNKPRIRAANSTLRTKSWKLTLPSFYKTVTNTSSGNCTYSHIASRYRQKQHPDINKDMVAYFQSIFGGLT